MSSLPARRGNGKDGAEVWPPEVEAAFMRGLRVVPVLGRKKHKTSAKLSGRNELIAQYIFKATGAVRSRKQVSSHIQVLKNTRKDDREFMALVSENPDVDEEREAEKARQFDELLRQLPGPKGATAGGARRKVVNPGALLRQDSAEEQPYLLPSEEEEEVPKPAQRELAASGCVRATSPDSLDLGLPATRAWSSPSGEGAGQVEQSTPAVTVPVSTQKCCPILPVKLCIWSEDTVGGRDLAHIFAAEELNVRATAPTRSISLDDLYANQLRYSGLRDMHAHFSCPFLHFAVPLDVPERPEDPAEPFPSQLRTQLSLTSTTAQALTCVISVYACGTHQASWSDQLAPASLISPQARATVAGAGTTSRHKYAYTAELATAFWQNYLPCNHPTPQGEQPASPSLCKSGAERDALRLALSGLSIVQEFVVRRERGCYVDSAIEPISPGSTLGTVVLVVCYDFTLGQGEDAGKARLSHLQVRHGSVAPGPMSRISPAPLQQENIPCPPQTTGSVAAAHLTPSRLRPLTPHRSAAQLRKLSLGMHTPPASHSSSYYGQAPSHIYPESPVLGRLDPNKSRDPFPLTYVAAPSAALAPLPPLPEHGTPTTGSQYFFPSFPSYHSSHFEQYDSDYYTHTGWHPHDQYDRRYSAYGTPAYEQHRYDSFDAHAEQGPYPGMAAFIASDYCDDYA